MINEMGKEDHENRKKKGAEIEISATFCTEDVKEKIVPMAVEYGFLTTYF